MVRFLRWTLIVFAVLITTLNFFGLEQFSRSPYHGIRHNNLVFLEFHEESPVLGVDLRAGDHIRAVDGVRVRNIVHFKYINYSNHDLAPQVYTFARGDSIFDIKINYIRQPQSKIFKKISLSFVAFTFILVGFYLNLKRPDILGRLFSVNCLMFSFILTERPAVSTPVFHVMGELFYDCLFAFLPAFFLHFFLIFPGNEIQKGTRRYTVGRLLYFPPALIFLSFFVLALINYTSEISHMALMISNGFVSIYWLFYMIGGVAMFIRTYMISDSIKRIKFRIAMLGLVIGTVPVTIVIVLKQFAPSFYLPFDYISVIFMSFISISFAYVILKHDAFDMKTVFRAGLAYVILPLFLAGLFYFIAKEMGEKFPEFPGIRHFPTMLASVILLLIAFLVAKAGVQKLADRLFFKDRKIFREQVIDFSRKIQFISSIPDISDFVSSELREFFESEYIHIFLKNDKKNFILMHSFPVDSNIPLTSFPAGMKLIELAAKKRQPVMIEYYDRLWIKNNLDRISLELLSIIDVSIMLPLIEQNEMLGFILLGKKKTGKLYNKTDVETLELIGERCSAAIRHNILYKVSVEKEKLEKEVHLASKIQKKLLPEFPPDLKNTKITGRLENSREVGGDFYDFVEFSEESVGIAVADVSGKGIPASLLMTTLQASFRAEATVEKSPGEVLSALNQSLFKRSDSSEFATFFYAIYNDNTGILHYSNGGSFPPVLLHADGAISQLKRGGILIGVDSKSVYNEGIVKLRPGDILAIYTDGVIDQENLQENYFGEKRFLDFLKNNDGMEPLALVDKLYDTLMNFGEGLLKDDMTTVILKRKKAENTESEKQTGKKSLL